MATGLKAVIESARPLSAAAVTVPLFTFNGPQTVRSLHGTHGIQKAGKVHSDPHSTSFIPVSNRLKLPQYR
jgi:hypothetical protein